MIDAEKTTWSVSRLRKNPLNPRSALKENGLDELAMSIRSQGILQPLLITPNGVVVAGHRRLEAAKRAGLDVVPVIVRELSQQEQQEIMLVENLQRDDLSPVEEGRAFQRLLDSGSTSADLARRLGFNQSRIHSRVLLTKLDDQVQQMFHVGDLPLTLAPVLLQVKDPARQRRLATLALRRRLTVAQLEKMAESGFVKLNAQPKRPILEEADPDDDLAPRRGRPPLPQLSATRQQSLAFLQARNGESIAFAELTHAFERVCCSCGMEDLAEICAQCPLKEFVDLLEAKHA